MRKSGIFTGIFQAHATMELNLKFNFCMKAQNKDAEFFP